MRAGGRGADGGQGRGGGCKFAVTVNGQGGVRLEQDSCVVGVVCAGRECGRGRTYRERWRGHGVCCQNGRRGWTEVLINGDQIGEGDGG